MMTDLKTFATTILPKNFFVSKKKDVTPGYPENNAANGQYGEDSVVSDKLMPERTTEHPHAEVVDETRSEGAVQDSDQRIFKPRTLRRIHSSDDTIASVDNSLDRGLSSSANLRYYEEEEITAFRSQANQFMRRFLSVFYCLILLVLGFSFPIAELTAAKLENNYYQGYYIFLFGVGIAYMIFSYLFLVSPVPRHTEIATSFRKWKRQSKKFKNQAVFDTLKTHLDPVEASYTSAGKAASFYLRLDAVFFGLGSMVFSGFEFGQFFEYPAGSRCRSGNAFVIPILRFMFTFAQLYFLFLNVRIRTDKFTTMTRFGLMHILGTNMVIWVTSLIEETRHAVVHYSNPAEHMLSGDHHDQHSTPLYDHAVGIDQNLSAALTSFSWVNGSFPDGAEMPFGVVADEIMDSCRRKSVIGQVLQHAAPVLYPFIVEYSLICAALMYVMWSNIGIFMGPGRYIQRLNRLDSNHSDGSMSNDLEGLHHNDHHAKRHQYTVDCKGSTNGMFLGVLAVVAMIISMVLFFFWINMTTYKFLALYEVYISIILLYVFTSVAVIVAFIRLQSFRFDFREGSKLDDVLLITSQMGVIVLNLFIVICGLHDVPAKGSPQEPEKRTADILGLLASSFEAVQSMIQTVFLLDAARRRPYKQSQLDNRPGREMITFLLVSNFGMWFLDTLESWRRQLHPVQIEFYGFWPWILITHISMPLTIFYRFHSSVCLSEVWKKSYKWK